MEITWEDGVPVLHRGEERWCLDRYYIRHGGRVIALGPRTSWACRRYGIFMGQEAVHLETIDGRLTLTREECGQFGALVEGVQASLNTVEAPGPQMRVTGDLDLASLPEHLEYLSLSGVQIDQLPTVDVLSLDQGVDHSPGALFAARYYLEAHWEWSAGSLPCRFQAPVIHLHGTSPDDHYYDCQILVQNIAYTREETPVWNTSAQYLVTHTGLYYQAGEDGFWHSHREPVPEDLPGLALDYEYRGLTYTTPPQVWIGTSPPPHRELYRLLLVTPPVTIWVRRGPKGAHTAQ